MKKVILVLAIFCFPPSLVMAKSAGFSKEESFSLANLVLADGKYDEAIKRYGKIEEMGIVNPDVYYNMGNAYYKAGKTGLAILYYEKSLKLSEKGDDVRYNIAVAKERLGLPAEEVDFRSPFDKLSGFTTFKGSADLTISLYMLTFMVMILTVLISGKKLRKTFRGAGLVFVALTMISATVTVFKMYRQENFGYGIIMPEEAGLYEAPLGQADPADAVRSGVKVRLVEDGKDWFKVSIPDGRVGWVKRETVGII